MRRWEVVALLGSAAVNTASIRSRKDCVTRRQHSLHPGVGHGPSDEKIRCMSTHR